MSKLDVMEEKLEYFGAPESFPSYPTADNILKTSGLTCSGQKMIGRA